MESGAAKKLDQELPVIDDESTVCFCHCVSRKTIKEAIAKGAHTIEKIRAETCANTGCGGCEFEVTELLEQELAQLKK
ncbi:MAG: (2Fe-2S)-binding protein [Bacteriovoracia bacterium]